MSSCVDSVGEICLTPSVNDVGQRVTKVPVTGPGLTWTSSDLLTTSRRVISKLKAADPEVKVYCSSTKVTILVYQSASKAVKSNGSSEVGSFSFL